MRAQREKEYMRAQRGKETKGGGDGKEREKWTAGDKREKEKRANTKTFGRIGGVDGPGIEPRPAFSIISTTSVRLCPYCRLRNPCIYKGFASVMPCGIIVVTTRREKTHN